MADYNFSPCPFCGSNNIGFAPCPLPRYYWSDITDEYYCNNSIQFYIKCYECGAHTDEFYFSVKLDKDGSVICDKDEIDGREKAIKKWNTNDLPNIILFELEPEFKSQLQNLFLKECGIIIPTSNNGKLDSKLIEHNKMIKFCDKILANNEYDDKLCERVDWIRSLSIKKFYILFRE